MLSMSCIRQRHLVGLVLETFRSDTEELGASDLFDVPLSLAK